MKQGCVLSRTGLIIARPNLTPLQPSLRNTELSPSSECWAHPLPGEGLLSSKMPAKRGLRLPLPSSQLTGNTKKDENLVEMYSDGLATPTWVGLVAEDELDEHRGRSRTRYQARKGGVPHSSSKSRLRAWAGLTYGKSPAIFLGMESPAKSTSSQERSGTNSAGPVSPRPRATCRFSREDYKHSHIVGWLERGA
jgi:hypothetical protein